MHIRTTRAGQGRSFVFHTQSEIILEHIRTYKNLIERERTHRHRVQAHPGITLEDHQTECDNLIVLIEWAEAEIWVMQRTVGPDTGSSMRLVFTVVLNLLIGRAFPVMRCMPEAHPCPPGISPCSATPGNGRRAKPCWYRSPLIRDLAGVTVCGTCRDCPQDYIDILYVKQELMTVSADGSDHLDHNGRVGHALAIPRDGFQNAFTADSMRKGRTRRRVRAGRKQPKADTRGIISEVCQD